MAGATGRSGRRAKPTARKLLAGNPGKRALNKEEPSFTPITGVDPPEWLSESAATMWRMVSNELCAQEVLCATDLHNLEMFCVAYANARAAQVDVAKNGITVTGAMGGVIKNPALTVLNEAMRQMASFGGMLGLDPSSRQRLVGANKKQSDNPFKNL
ncbi:phage terminase small subunit P27 family [Escherichia coli]|uniref:phage terminase small subunit P27 family n=1 Tax=Escherichia coli TaxID=562 RepID=UPI001AB05C25|nr:phage terminase small subunit P27 family [Escherichia coli]MBO3239453.1 phage terminase small subunit P27 family [Escherichia coli]